MASSNYQDESFEELLDQYEKIRLQLQDVLTDEQELNEFTRNDVSTSVLENQNNSINSDDDEELLELQLRLHALESTLGKSSNPKSSLPTASTSHHELCNSSKDVSSDYVQNLVEEDLLREVCMFTGEVETDLHNSVPEETQAVINDKTADKRIVERSLPPEKPATVMHRNCSSMVSLNADCASSSRVMDDKDKVTTSVRGGKRRRRRGRLNDVLMTKRRILSMDVPDKQCGEFLRMESGCSTSTATFNASCSYDNYETVNMDVDDDRELGSSGAGFVMQPSHQFSFLDLNRFYQHGSDYFAPDLTITVNSASWLNSATVSSLPPGFVPDLPPLPTPPPPPPLFCSPLPPPSKNAKTLKGLPSEPTHVEADAAFTTGRSGSSFDDDLDNDEDVLRLKAFRSLLLKKKRNEKINEDMSSMAQDIIVQYTDDDLDADDGLSISFNDKREILLSADDKDSWVVTKEIVNDTAGIDDKSNEVTVHYNDDDSSDRIYSSSNYDKTNSSEVPLSSKDMQSNLSPLPLLRVQTTVSKSLPSSATNSPRPAQSPVPYHQFVEQFSSQRNLRTTLVRNHRTNNYLYKPPPQHSTVIIPLSSSDEDNESSDNECVQVKKEKLSGEAANGLRKSCVAAMLEDYLKRAKESTNSKRTAVDDRASLLKSNLSAPVVEYSMLDQRLRACEQDISKHSRLINEDKNRLNMLQTVISTHKKELTKAEINVQRLKQRLIKAEAVMSGRRHLVDKLAKEMETVSNRITSNIEQQKQYERQLKEVSSMLDKQRSATLNVHASTNKKMPVSHDLVKQLEARKRALEQMKKDCVRKMKLIDSAKQQNQVVQRSGENVNNSQTLKGVLVENEQHKTITEFGTEKSLAPSEFVQVHDNAENAQATGQSKHACDNVAQTLSDSVVICPQTEVLLQLDSDSPLLCFRSYRFTRQFSKLYSDMKSPVLPRFTHRLDTKKALCPFELFGECKDSSCVWQHKAEYSPSKSDIISDILAYQPNLSKDSMAELFRCFGGDDSILSAQCGKNVTAWLEKNSTKHNVIDTSLRYVVKLKATENGTKSLGSLPKVPK